MRGLMFMVITSSVLLGCGASYASSARRAIYVAAETLKSVDQRFAVHYEEQAEAALQASASIREYRRRMTEFDEIEISLRAAHIALLAAEAGVDLYEDSGRKVDLEAGIACAILVFEDLFERLDTIYGQAPQGIVTSIAGLKAYEGRCRDGIYDGR